MNSFYLDQSKVFLQTIQAFEVICIFRHEHPDCDALGAQCGLLTWLKTYFPNKKIYALGNENSNQFDFPQMDKVSDDILQNALAIILDTANLERVDDQRYALAKHIMKIDHHIITDDYGDTKIVLEGCAATCQILTLLIHQLVKYPLNKTIAQYFYAGLVTDCLNFSANYTNDESLLAGSYLVGCGLEVAKIQQRLFDQDLHDIQFKIYLLSHMQIFKEHIAYVILEHDDLVRWSLSASEARSRVNTLSGIKEFAIWVLFTYDIETSSYAASIRSKQIAINEVANHYHGGGHKNACGVKGLSLEDVQNILNDLAKLLSNF